MNNWEETLINKNLTVIDTIKKIDSTVARISLVVDDHLNLVGTVTDGDIRRGILKGVDLNKKVDNIVNRSPVVGKIGGDKNTYEKLIRLNSIHQLPLVDSVGKVCGLYISTDLYPENIKDNPVVLMVGGLGSRLGELTRDCPKPMLRIGGKPILGTIIKRFKSEGFRKFYLAVNYKSEVIEDYFGDGREFGVNIQYLREDKRMGTAGSLSLIEDVGEHPLIVMNGDLLTSISFNEMINFHNQSKTKATMTVREYDFQVPFGVVETNGTEIKSILEKPIKKFFVNAGIYVIEANLLSKIPNDEFYDMPSLFNSLINGGIKTGVFPIREYWRDIGRREDFEIADIEYQENFK